MLVSCLTYSSTLKMEETCSSETLIFQRSAFRYVPDDRTLYVILFTDVMQALFNGILHVHEFGAIIWERKRNALRVCYTCTLGYHRNQRSDMLRHCL
jgi:hypothetical protein